MYEYHAPHEPPPPRPNPLSKQANFGAKSSSLDLIYNPAMLASCAPALASRCNKTVAHRGNGPMRTEWDAEGIRCLEDHVHDADTPAVCAKAVEGMLRIKHKDYRLNAALMVSCKADIASLAKG